MTDTSDGDNNDMTFKDVSMEDLKAAVVDVLGENYWPDMPADAEMLSQIYGVTSDMYEEYLAESPMISANVDTLIIIKAKEGKVSAVEEALGAYKRKDGSDWHFGRAGFHACPACGSTGV